MNKEIRIALTLLMSSSILVISAPSYSIEKVHPKIIEAEHNKAILKLRLQAKACTGEGKKKCVDVCVRAMKEGNKNISNEFKSLSSQCNSLSSSIEENQKPPSLDPKRPALLENYRWMPDNIVAISISNTGHSDSFSDFRNISGKTRLGWQRKCRMGMILNMPKGDKRIASLSSGTEVRLKYIQTSGSICRVGMVEVLM